ncbi:MAG: DUF58 domain-containing protein [Planctomycetota bacterium]|nr:DUF58 domain-containing protein [Planctomycetota bacterium]
MLKRRVVTIGREGVYYLFVLGFIMGGAALRDVNLLFVLAGLMIGPMLLNWRMVVLAVRQLEVERRLPKQVFAGQPFLVQMLGHNRRPRLGSWMLVLEDTLQAEGTDPDSGKRFPRVAAQVLLPYVAPGRWSRADYRVVLPQRGVYRFGPLRASTGFPLGLVRASVRQGHAERLVVYPRLGRLSPGWTGVLEATPFGRYQTYHRQGPVDGDYYGLREWRRGDSRRWIHWRTTAKLGKLVVRQFEQLQNRDLALVLDLWRPPVATPEDLARVELAVSFAASVVEELCRRGGSRLIVALAAEESGAWSATASSLFARQTMERLAVARGCAENRLAETLGSVVEQLQPGVQMAVFSTRSSQLGQAAHNEVFAGRPRQQRGLAQTVWLNVSEAQVGSVFQLDPSPS